MLLISKNKYDLDLMAKLNHEIKNMIINAHDMLIYANN
jgi:hypothetical protein